MMQLVLIVLTNRKEMICYCKPFGYGGKSALDKRFYRSNGVSIHAENGSNIPIMGFSNHHPSGLFTNKFRHVSINNKIISKNREEACTIPNSSTKAANNKIRPSTTK
jgi:hypothetical protein